MNYQDVRQLLADMGIWAPKHPGSRNKILRWCNEDGQCIHGTNLNDDNGVAYFTLRTNCTLREDGDLWSNRPPPSSAPEKDKNFRNIYPKPGKEREALLQLFDSG